MQLTDAVLLTAIDRFGGERSERSLFHVLNGKKTATTLQDAFYYDAGPVFGLFPLSSYELERVFADYERRGLVDRASFSLTPEGRQWTEPPYVQALFDTLGGEHREMTSLVWRRFSLFIQTVMSRHHQKSFFPVQSDREAERWVKHVLQSRGDFSTILQTLHTELKEQLSKLSEDQARAISFRMSGAFDSGYTFKQIGELLDTDAASARLIFLSGWHELLRTLEPSATMMAFLDGLDWNQMTHSASESYRLFRQGHTFDEVKQMRRLRPSTIEDHVVEMAMYVDTFPLHQFVDLELVREAERLKREGSWALKPIYDAVPDLSYFQIRLILARLKRGETFV